MARKALYIGIDLGGTKVHAALVSPGGIVLERVKTPTPAAKAKHRGKLVIDTIVGCANELLEISSKKYKLPVSAIGLAMPGPVNYANNTVPFMPNLDIAGADLAGTLTDSTSAKVVLANDADATAAGEAWFGPSGENAHCFIDMAVGTGIGGGIIIDNQLYSGIAGSCAEIGHLIMNPGGELCGCGNRGCAETLASRTAIERMLREEMENGQAEILKSMLDEQDTKIRSGIIARSLKAGDPSVKKVLNSVAESLGLMCLSLRHLLSPDVIALGGGVMEACGDAMLPIIRKVVAKSHYMSDHPLNILLSALGDDAAIVGAAAIAMKADGLNLGEIQKLPASKCQNVKITDEGFSVDGELFFAGDMTINVYGQVSPRRKNATECLDCTGKLKVRDLRRACTGGPKIIYIGSSTASVKELKNKPRTYLESRAIKYELLDMDSAISAFNKCPQRKALMVLRGQ